MGIRTSPTEIHWNYFLAVEADLIELSRFVEFNPKNYNCFSVEMAKLLMASAGEVDVVLQGALQDYQCGVAGWLHQSIQRRNISCFFG